MRSPNLLISPCDSWGCGMWVSREQVQEAIVTEVGQGTRIVWGDLLSSLSSDERENHLAEAFKLAKQEYWRLISAWLNEALPPLRQLDRAICCGGTADLLSENLKDYFKDFGNLDFTQTQQRQLLQALQLNLSEAKRFDRRNLALRFADCWGFFVNFAGYSPIALRPVTV